MARKFDLQLRAELVADRFNRYLQELVAIDPALEFSAVVRAEAAAVMLAALARTRAANLAKIRAGVRARDWVTFNGKRYHIGEAGVTSMDPWRLPDPLWAQIDAYRQRLLQTKLDARGLSKQSWLHLARQLRRGEINAPAYVAAANFEGRQYPENVSALDGATPAGYILTVLNASPVVQHANGAWALVGAMQGRVSYFRRNMELRAFQTLESRARKYPGIWVSPPIAA